MVILSSLSNSRMTQMLYQLQCRICALEYLHGHMDSPLPMCQFNEFLECIQILSFTNIT